jgi:hypothetical protein
LLTDVFFLQVKPVMRGSSSHAAVNHIVAGGDDTLVIAAACADGVVRVWQLSQHQLESSQDMSGHPAPLGPPARVYRNSTQSALALNSSGSKLALGMCSLSESATATLKIVDIGNWWKEQHLSVDVPAGCTGLRLLGAAFSPTHKR